MESGAPQRKSAGWRLYRRLEKKGMRPRYAASVIAAIWLVGVITFGVAEHLVDRETYPNVWLGLWWALETVSTVGYGDVVPAQTAGKIIASFLLLGGLSFLAVVTGVVTSLFVNQAQEQKREAGEDPVIKRLDELARELAAVQKELARPPRR